jgi:predicted PolB exonuclease-like 3'-5' exonuclease
MALILDIECVATADALTAYDPDERTPPANYKSEEAVAKWRESDKAAFLRDATFSPRTSQIVAIGLYDDLAQPDERAQVLTADVYDERAIIHNALVNVAAAARLVTFNGLGFDLPFLLTRAALLGVNTLIKPIIYLRRYTPVPHTDLFAILSNYGPARKGDSLHGWARAFGLPIDDQHSGADIAALHAAGEWDAIRAHCRSDVTLTAALYERLLSTGRLD